MNDIWWQIEHPGLLLQWAGAVLSVIFAVALLIRFGWKDATLIVLLKLLLLGVINWFIVIPGDGMAMRALRDSYYYEFRNTQSVFEILLFMCLAVAANFLLLLWLFGNSDM